ncbi:glycosyltransferase family 2 protein [Shewanella aestuarii]|uniref:Glycosyltransferase n=1 Tax=Shewanella aestuarii TaxID=1028752 RepID=A0A6G9QIH9_9GAMM|nr:glycosyltransferase family 2 protein [Shewanella aestuarii]QIR13943.1 glycosyltransferase [Shewanella aestuarii]
MNTSLPKVSIGMPVFNGGEYIADAIESILNQTFTDYEIIISDNCSNDTTGKICQHYAQNDSRIRYIKQSSNIGAEANFNFVFKQSVAKYFMWAAVDDIRSPKFLEVNYQFLNNNLDFVSSTSQARLADLKNNNQSTMGCWELNQDRVVPRLITFYSSWHANSLFYGLHRRHSIASWRGLNSNFHHFLGGDWDLVVHLLNQGKMHCDMTEYIQLGAAGSCRISNLYSQYRRNLIDDFIPFRDNSVQALKVMLKSNDWTIQEAFQLLNNLYRYNNLGRQHRIKIEQYDANSTIIAQRLSRENINEIIICGAGEIGMRLAAVLLEHDIKVLGFTDKMANDQQVKILGNKIPVLTLEQASKLDFKDYIIASNQFAVEISQELMQLTAHRQQVVNIHYLTS